VLEPHVDLVAHNGNFAQGAFAHAAGRLAVAVGDLDTAVAYLDVAVRLHEHLAAPFFTARSKLELGLALRRRANAGDRVQSMILLGEALDLAERHRCDYVASRVRAAQEGTT
jgi:hypothetical protein